MRYPTISQYIETIENPHGRFRTLRNIRADSDMFVESLFYSGNYAAVFPVEIDSEKFAMKCYTRPCQRLDRLTAYLKNVKSKYFPQAEFMPEEIFVYDESGRGNYYPVKIMKWIEGMSLRKAVEYFVRQKDKTSISKLATAFDKMALWLLQQPFAHGDIKDDNIVTTLDADMTLIDFDSAYIPEFAGMQSLVLGSSSYQHPLRDENMYDNHIDYYPLVLICVSLHALATNPLLFYQRDNSDSLLFNASTVFEKDKATVDELCALWQKLGETDLVEMCRSLASPSPEITDVVNLFCNLCLKY